MLTATLSIPRCLTTVQQGVKDQRPDSRHVDTRLNGYAGLSGSRLWKIKKRLRHFLRSIGRNGLPSYRAIRPRARTRWRIL